MLVKKRKSVDESANGRYEFADNVNKQCNRALMVLARLNCEIARVSPTARIALDRARFPLIRSDFEVMALREARSVRIALTFGLSDNSTLRDVIMGSIEETVINASRF